jgi:mannose-6-phosphate isomerase-like protein (cupin superfamily)
MTSRKIACALLAVVAVLGWSAIARAEEPPKGNKGYTTPKTVVINLGPGHIGIHNHKDRPAVVYFLQGTDTVTNEDGTAKTFHAGDTTAEGVKTVHWHRNAGKDAVIIVTGDLVKSAK